MVLKLGVLKEMLVFRRLMMQLSMDRAAVAISEEKKKSDSMPQETSFECFFPPCTN
jgi:hypothetical protein